MGEENTFFHVMRIIVLCLNPIVFFVGILLLTFNQDKVNKLEEKLGAEVGGKKKFIPQLERKFDVLQKFLLVKKQLVGWFSILYSIASFLLLKRP